MGRKALLFAVLIGLLAAFASTSPSYAQGSCTNTLTQPSGQSFWVGSVTSTNQNGAVVVFVHGYTSDHNTWTGSNYAVRDACAQGFRVAAVDLGGSASIWNNGQSLATKLQAISSYYGVSKVNIMAHSKGGLDSQAAIVFYGGHQYVQRYIAFGSPFGGTDLADHACSWYGSWLWQCNDATMDMRTGNMTYVRSITDPRAENNNVLGYAARGSKCDWYNPACALISGADDGVVPTWSAWANGRDTHISDRSDLRHGEVHQTQRYNVSWLFNYLGRATATEGESKTENPAVISRNNTLVVQSNMLLRGGEVAGRTVETIPVETGIAALDLTVIAAADVTLSAISPSGTTYDFAPVEVSSDAILQGSTYTARITRPEAGNWQIAMTANAPADFRVGYYLKATLEGGLSVRVANDLRTVFQPGDLFPLRVAVAGRTQNVIATATLRDNNQNVVAQADGLEAALALPVANGIYNLDVTVTGLTADGKPFERTLVTSIAVVDLANLEDPATVR
jgi:pimeloyl-ACP methyl ester carboxylesterase